MLEKLLAIKHDSAEPAQAHTVAVISRNETGQAGLFLECFRPRCGCSRFIALAELIIIMEGLEIEGDGKREKGKGNGKVERDDKRAA